jgi:hypothetical protein
MMKGMYILLFLSCERDKLFIEGKEHKNSEAFLVKKRQTKYKQAIDSKTIITADMKP